MFTATLPFSVGANLPWIRYGGGFGANTWRSQDGLAAGGYQVPCYEHLDATFLQLASSAHGPGRPVL